MHSVFSANVNSVLCTKMSRIPLVVVLGATGTGKSNLAVKIAKKFNGEIISADSMQVYRGLDIASNKVSKAEMAGVPHHMLDICGPMDRFTALDFRNRTLPIIEDILKRKKLPVIVGGTNYYIESVLWETLFAKPDENSEFVLQRYQVLIDPDEINKWKTYEASVLPKLNSGKLSEAKNCDTLETEIKANRVTVDDLNRLFNEIERVKCDFRYTVDNLANRMKISFSIYNRTFYKINLDGRDDSCKRVDNAELESKFANIVDVESALMDNYVHVGLERIHSSINDIPNDSEVNCDVDFVIPNFVHYCNMEIVSHVLTERLPKVCASNKRLEQLRNFCCFHEHLIPLCYVAVRKIVENVINMAKVRVNRLRLVRIVDDEGMLDYTNEELYAELKLLDADASKIIHPNNRRKVVRAIQIYFGSGQTYTKFLDEQHQMEGGCAVSAPMRFPDSCLLWICCDQFVLERRLDERVKQMIKNGLIKELENFHKMFNEARLKLNENADYSKGVFQSIGLKEFHSYLMLDEEEKSSQIGEVHRLKGIEYMKVATKRYSRLQYRTIMNRYIRIPDVKKVPPIFELDGTDLEKWEENVESKALSIVEDYLNGEDLYSLKYSPILREEPHPDRFQDGQYHCDICQRLFIGQYQWHAHYASKGHRKQLYKLKIKKLHKKIAVLKKPVNNDDKVEVEEEDEQILELLR